MQLRRLNGCEEHTAVPVNNLMVSACATCRQVDWQGRDGEVDPSEGMAALFGAYELMGTLDALGSPAPEVLVYQAPSTRKLRHLSAFPKNQWVKAAPDLWLTHDGERLLLATNHKLLFQNLSRDL